MPYYVYAICTDNTDNSLYGKYEKFGDSEKMKKEMSAVNVPRDNYFVRSFYAVDDFDADKKATEMRPKS